MTLHYIGEEITDVDDEFGRPVDIWFSSEECKKRWEDGTIDPELGFSLVNAWRIYTLWFDDKEDMARWFRGEV